MLRGKRAVITGGGTGFGQALSVWLAREGVEVDFCARRADDIQKTCSIITAEGGMAKGHLCDLTLPESLSQFSSQLLTLDKPIDILILNAAQWLSGTLDDQSDTEIINTISSGLTGSIRKRAARTVLTGMCYSVGSATRQGSSSLTRFIGQSAMTSRT
ncbi:SDR family NAD(P)-dependent oxidoreductase [Klebsiella pneumoniae]